MNIALIPVIGYMGSAIAVFTCYLVMMVLSYFWGQKYYPVPYNLKRIGTYFLITLGIYIFSLFTDMQSSWIKFSVNALLFCGFIYAVWKMERYQLGRLFKI
jgi:O-antigen/teichoic acid export membrane protein